MGIKVLHIANDYSGSTVYKNLIGELDFLGLSQIVYSPIRESTRIGKNKIEFNIKESNIIYSHILNNSLDRLFYRFKVIKTLKDIEAKIDLSTIDFIHAHTWYSDGGVAYLLSRKFNISYIVTVRNSDLNFFQKYLIHEHFFGRKILENAENVVLISPPYKRRLLSEGSLQRIKNKLLSKLIIIPNGVDEYWINNAVKRKLHGGLSVFNILFIGKFTYNKNVLLLQSAIRDLNREGIVAHLHLVGGGGNAHDKVLDQVKLNSGIMTFYGQTYDPLELAGHFKRCDIFAMPSKHETFGLVYVEALLQGLPILYTQYEGIDDFYLEKIGEKVSSNKVDEIKQKLLTLIRNYDSYVVPTNKLIKNHDWKKIALIYQDLYNKQ